MGELLRTLTNIIPNLLQSLIHPVTLLLATLVASAILQMVVGCHSLVATFVTSGMHHWLWFFCD